MRTSEDAIDEVLRETKTAVLSFSAGKDSLGAWLALRDRIEIRAYYMYLVPGLEFIEESLAYYEQFFATSIKRVPNPALYRMLNNGVFQPPERMDIIRGCRLPYFKFDQLRDWICEYDFALPARTWTASGVRASDSLARQCAFKKLAGGLNRKRKIFYPVFDWSQKTLEERLLSSGVKLPVDYAMFGRSFDGLDFRYLGPIKKHFPRDYAKICDWFPLCETEFHRGK